MDLLFRIPTILSSTKNVDFKLTFAGEIKLKLTNMKSTFFVFDKIDLSPLSVLTKTKMCKGSTNDIEPV